MPPVAACGSPVGKKQKEVWHGGGRISTVSRTCWAWPRGSCWPEAARQGWLPAVLAASAPLLCLGRGSAGPSTDGGLVPDLAVSAPGLPPAPTAASASMPVPHLLPLLQQWLSLTGLPVGICLLLLHHCGSALMSTGHNHPRKLLPPEKLLPAQRAALLRVTTAGICVPLGHCINPFLQWPLWIMVPQVTKTWWPRWRCPCFCPAHDTGEALDRLGCTPLVWDLCSHSCHCLCVLLGGHCEELFPKSLLAVTGAFYQGCFLTLLPISSITDM